MNINEYISSGIIEQYVLGEVSSQEKQEVECMSHIYPEIQEELANVQVALEGYAMENAIEVPSHIKKNIFELIDAETKKMVVALPKIVEMKSGEESKIVSIKSNKKYLVAASLAFVIASSIAAYSLLNANSKELAFNNKIESLNKEKTLSDENFKTQLAQFSLQNNKPFVLQCNAKAPGKTMVVFWNKNTGNVYVNNVQLPQTPTNKQYQLWALKGGKPIDLGVFNADGTMQNMKIVESADAFAVTLEDKGGSPSPHLDQLYGLVNIQG